MDERSGQLNAESIRAWWKKHGRLMTLVGAFALPIFCCSPLFLPPFADSVPFHSPVGVMYQVLQRMPGLMTEIGFLVWLAWRSGWRPTQTRCLQMFAASIVALILLPVLYGGLQSFTALHHTQDWRSALATTWQWFGPPQAFFMAVGHVCRALVIYLVLRAAVWARSVALIEPGHETSAIRPQFSIRALMIVTTIIAMTVVFVPMILRRYLWADQVDYLTRLGLSLVANGMESVFLAIIICAVAWLGWRSMDVMIPWLAVLSVAAVGLMYVAFRIRSILSDAFGQAPSFSVFASIPFAIALVLASLAVFALFRSLGLPVTIPSKQLK